MTNHSSAPYLRLRNLNSNTSTTVTEDDEVQPVSMPGVLGQSARVLRRRVFSRNLVFVFSLILNLVAIWYWMRSMTPRERILTYSPAASVVENERVVFSSAFGIERSPFQGPPSDANDKLWADLYDFGISRISASEAAPMDNKTLPVPDEEGGYLVQIAVFHHLHCLNLIRKGVYGGVDMSNEDDLMGIEHLDHCIDMLRQSIMCNSDVTPITFARTSLDTSMKVVAEVVHTCRKFSKIQQWAWDRRIKGDLDKDKVVYGDPLAWGAYTFSP